jgi:hypothetical protein
LRWYVYYIDIVTENTNIAIGLRMVTVASDFLSMLNGKWSSEKLQDEQFKDKLE